MLNLSAGEWGNLGKTVDGLVATLRPQEAQEVPRSETRWGLEKYLWKYQVHSPILIFVLRHLVTVIIGGNNLGEHGCSFVLTVAADNLRL